MQEEDDGVEHFKSLGDVLRGSKLLAPFAAAAKVPIMIEPDELRQILSLVLAIGKRVDRLEKGLIEAVEMKLEVTELQVARDLDLDHQDEINQLLAYQLGGRLEKIKPPPPPPPLPRLIIDNTRGPSDAE